uniref:MARVEL domain-containing protein n=1 Tax=Panagrolaimus sp. ES5 TaxID=591445 RepID=A0AC34FWT9_9BILA
MASSSAPSADPSTKSNEHKQQLIIITQQPTPITRPSKIFDANSPEYRCCGGCMHIRHAAITVAIIDFVFSFMALGNYYSGEGYMFALIYFISSMFHFPIAFCLVIGAIIQNRYLLIPYMIYTIVDIIITIVVFCLMVVLVIKRSDLGALFAISYGFGLACGIALALWFTWIIYKCYVYFRERDSQLASGAVIMGQI